MKRRDFLNYATLSGIILSTSAVLTSCESVQSPEEDQNSSGKIPSFELTEKSVKELQAYMESGQYTAQQLVELYLKRIKEIDQNGPNLNSVLEINPDAIEIARALDEERKTGNIRGPLHGIPIMIKDNIDTGDKMMTTAGALALVGNYAPQDSFVAQKLREAGANILGKTNLSEWANFRSTRSSSGWSGRGGQTRNPYILDRNPCGSSSGSGVAASASLCAMTIGTETNGSVVCPSSTNGIVGIKPTVGLVSRSGIIPISETQDTAGPMARTVEDAAILLGALTGIDPRDPRTRESEGKAQTDYTSFLDTNGLDGKRIGIVRKSFGFHEEVDKLMEAAIQLMKARGATLIDLENNIIPSGLGQAGFDLMLYEFKDGVNKYLASVKSDLPVKNLEEVIAYNKEHADQSMPYFKQEILEMAQAKGDLNSPEYLEAREKVLRFNRAEGIDKVMDENQLDALIAPTGGPAWLTDLINDDHYVGGSSSPAARAGYPNITVPAGFIHGLPVGISFFGRAYSEPKLLAIAFAYEQASKHRKAPEFFPTLRY